MKKLLFTILLFAGFLYAHQVGATAYYIDFQCGSTGTCGVGTATTTSFYSLDQFTETARSAGDIAFVRRGVASTTGISDLTFTSDGTMAAPIIIQADYDNLWNDFATSSETWSPTVGSTYIASSASTTSAYPGKWFYIQGDCQEIYNNTAETNCEFAYEISTASSSGISLYIPYKGNGAGTGKEMRVMPSNPQWNVASGDFQWILGSDDYWKIQGIDIRGTDVSSILYINSSLYTQIIDCIFIGNGTNDSGIKIDFGADTIIKKIRSNNNSIGFIRVTAGHPIIELSDTFIKNTGVGIDLGFGANLFAGIILNNIIMTGGTTGIVTNYNNTVVYGRNVILSGSTAKISINRVGSNNNFVKIEDYQNIINANQQNLGLTTVSGDTPQLLSTSTASVIRSGGGSTSMEVRPTTNFGIKWDFSIVKLFEYPIYADTTNKTYSMYFYATSTTAFTADPTADEFWIECEAYGATSGADRKIVKSTGTIDFNGTAGWQSLSVNCQPTQAGIVYLRGYYGKTKETGRLNYFYMDVAPVISTP